MIYITGDCHSDFRRFSTDIFPEQFEMTKDDYVIMCGDFGGVWEKDKESSREKWWLNWLEANNNKVDLIVSHCCASSTQACLGGGMFGPDTLTTYFEETVVIYEG